MDREGDEASRIGMCEAVKGPVELSIPQSP